MFIWFVPLTLAFQIASSSFLCVLEKLLSLAPIGCEEHQSPVGTWMLAGGAWVGATLECFAAREDLGGS